MKFWLEKCPFSGEPRYAVEMYGHTRIFSRLEFLCEFRDTLRGTRWDGFKQIVLTPLKNYATGRTWVNGKLRAIRYGPPRAFSLIRHQYEIAQFLDTAIAAFRANEGHSPSTPATV